MSPNTPSPSAATPGPYSLAASPLAGLLHRLAQPRAKTRGAFGGCTRATRAAKAARLVSPAPSTSTT